MPVNWLYSIYMSFKFFKDRNFLLFSLPLNITYNTSLISQSTNNFSLGRGQADIHNSIHSSLYSFAINVVQINFKHIYKWKHSLFVSNKNMTTVVKTLYSSHSSTKTVIKKIFHFSLIYINEIYIPSFQLFIITKYNHFTIF